MKCRVKNLLISRQCDAGCEISMSHLSVLVRDGWALTNGEWYLVTWVVKQQVFSPMEAGPLVSPKQAPKKSGIG
jgi:hypothetical protein